MPEKSKSPNLSHYARSVQLINSGKSVPVIGLVRTKPTEAALISKLHDSREQNRFETSGQTSPVNRGELERISNAISSKKKDYRATLEMFPDIEISRQILISNIISPKDMVDNKIIHTIKNNTLPSDLQSILIDEVKKVDEEFIKSKEKLPKLLSSVLFEEGCYFEVVLAENQVDYLINGPSKISMEAFNGALGRKTDIKNKTYGGIGILGNKKSNTQSEISLENLFNYNPASDYNPKLVLEGNVETSITIVDNPNILKLPKLMNRLVTDNISKVFKQNNVLGKSFALESNKKLSKRQIKSLIFKPRDAKVKNYVSVPTEDDINRETIGRPLVMRWPAEAVIPVYVPGDETEHVGYWVILDINGNPVNYKDNVSHINDLRTRLSDKAASSRDLGSVLMSKAKTAYGSDACQPGGLGVDEASRLYADIIEDELLNRLKNGVYGSDFKIGRDLEIYRLMLARTWANQTTQILYLPKSICTYFAIKYDDNGIGKSMLDDSRMLNNMRAMTDFAAVMASVKNSIGRTQVNLKLDERDPDPQKTIEESMHEIAKTRRQNFPLGVASAGDLVDWVQTAGLEFTFEGHPRIPDMKVDITEKASNHAQPDTNLRDELKKRSIQATGIPPEVVDSAEGPDFATALTENNLRLAKQVIQIQETIMPMYTKHVRKILLSDGTFLDKAKKILLKNIEQLKNVYINSDEGDELKEELGQQDVNIDSDELIKYALTDFINSVELELPKPDTKSLEKQIDALNIYSDGIDKYLDSVISDDMFNNVLVGDISNHTATIKSIYKAHLIRDYMSRNNIFPELLKLSAKGADGKPEIDLTKAYKSHLQSVMQNVTHLIKTMQPAIKAVNKDIANLGVDGSSGGFGDMGDSSSSISGGDSLVDMPSMDDTPTDTPDGDVSAGSDTQDPLAGLDSM